MIKSNGILLSIRIYYLIRPLLPKWLQLMLRRWQARRKRRLYSNIWPIKQETNKPPTRWSGWPEQKKFALVLTHDVDTSRGHDKCKQMIRLEEKLGFRSAIYFVPERYQVSLDLRSYMTSRGFEVGVHGLNHDGKLYWSRRIFNKRTVKINRYLKEWNSIGFRSPAMHYKPSWLHDLKIEYDTSTFDTDPFEPYPSTADSIFPICVPGSGKINSYIELPYTMPQDWTLFALLKESSINIWKKKLDWIAKNGGMVLLITHPDYMSWDAKELKTYEYPAKYYEELLNYINNKYHGQYWHVLPRDMARFWVKNIKSIESKVPKGRLNE